MTVTAEASDCVVAYDGAAGCVVMTWRGYGSSGRFRASNERVLEAIARHGASRLLGDIEALGEIAPEDQAWLTEDWIPRAVSHGLRRAALVTPAFEVGHAAVLLVGERLSAPELRFFDEIEAGRAWLASA